MSGRIARPLFRDPVFLERSLLSGTNSTSPTKKEESNGMSTTTKVALATLGASALAVSAFVYFNPGSVATFLSFLNQANINNGPQGPAGVNGVNGTPGNKGDTGPQGPTGDKGQDGAQGIPGPAGVNGVNGTPGNKGDTGPQGAKGQDGAQGPQGIPGPAGAPGANGLPGQNGVCDSAKIEAYVQCLLSSGTSGTTMLGSGTTNCVY